MAFDKGQLVMHQLQVKAKRMEGGLERLVQAIKNSKETGTQDETVVAAYRYALGCLGGDYLKRELFATDDFERVVTELRDANLMKVAVADKNIAIWRDEHPKMELNNTKDEVKKEKSQAGRDEPSKTEVQSPKPTMFGEFDSDGNLVPVKKASTYDYAAPVMVESKSGAQPSGLSFGEGQQTVKRGPIYCY